ncbi:MAG: FAD-binding oxidoreductase [Gemmataceae bacterium]|nr:FAD-binding oxidoreductase [Gemmataceae bacterium]
MQPSTCLIDGFGPLTIVRPSSVAELGDVVRGAASKNHAIYAIGGRTQLGLGNRPTKPGIAVELCGLDQVIDFPARDMTVTVQAGITMARLQALLAPENLRLPIDVPQAAQATLGGILATNVSGPRRYGYGTLRDYVIGISAVNDAGHEFSAGGRVVKNVAGYDLCKLLIGSLGTLGIITQVTLKLRPLAEENALIAIGCAETGLEKLLAGVHGSQTRPVCVELLNQRAAQAVFGAARTACPGAPWSLVVGYEGNADAVNWQVQQLVKELGGSHSLNARVGETAAALWQALIDWQELTQARIVFKANQLPSDVARLCSAANANAPQPAIQAHAGNGIVHYAYEEVVPFTEHAPVEFGLGTIIAVRLPSDLKSGVGVWGNAPPANAWLMRAVKQQYDPRGLFNPGRFVDGI